MHGCVFRGARAQEGGLARARGEYLWRHQGKPYAYLSTSHIVEESQVRSARGVRHRYRPASASTVHASGISGQVPPCEFDPRKIFGENRPRPCATCALSATKAFGSCRAMLSKIKRFQLGSHALRATASGELESEDELSGGGASCPHIRPGETSAMRISERTPLPNDTAGTASYLPMQRQLERPLKKTSWARQRTRFWRQAALTTRLLRGLVKSREDSMDMNGRGVMGPLLASA